MRPTLRISLALLIVAACAPDTSTEAQDVARVEALRHDSSGVAIVASELPWWAGDEGWTLAESPDLVIGSLEGRAGDDFGSVRDLAVLSDGRIVVGDHGARQLRVFDAEGRPTRVFGRAGDGPGEFAGIRMVERFAGDTLLVFDWSNARLSYVGPDFELLRTEPVRTRVPGITMPHVKAITAAGVPIMTGARPPWVEEDVEFYGQPQHLLVRDGDEYFDREIAVSPGKGFLDVHYGALGDHVLVVHGGDFEVRAYGTETGLERLIRRTYDAPPIPDEFFEKRLDPFGNTSPVTLTGVGSDGESVTIATQLRDRDPADYPATLPAVDDLLVDHTGHLWLRHGAWPGDGDRTWSIFRPDGQWLGEIVTPAGLTVFDVTETHLYGVRTDDFDVQYVVRFPLLVGG